ncbi:ATP-grasp domain-containing protein [Mesorhizobium sp. J8]|nr:ATP-grasp domain-containing protein [Mesorhizobium sp. J8]
MRLYVQAARRLGLHPIILSANPGQYDHLAAEAIEAIRVDTENLDALIAECSRLRTTYDISGITSAVESTYTTVGKLCRHFGLPGPNPGSIERCCNKFEQREFLAKAGVPVPSYRLAENAAEVESSAAEIGLPVVVKPAVGSGSVGVRLCCTADEIAQHLTYLLGGMHMWRTSPRILVEEFVQGQQYTAQIMGDEIIGIEAAHLHPPPRFVFRQWVFPAPVTSNQREHIAEVSQKCLRALDLGWGPTNIELRWTRRGPVVVEVNPRMPGWPDPQLVQQAYGVDLVAEHIKLVIGDQWDLRSRHSKVAAARNLVPDSDGILDWITGGSQAAAVPGVTEVKLYGEPKMPIVRKGDYRDCLGYVIAATLSLPETEAALQRAVKMIDWSIVPLQIERE